MQALRQHGKLNRVRYAAIRITSSKIEYGFYFATLYSLTSEVFGVSVPMVAGGLFLLLAGICVFQLRSSAKTIYAPIGLLIACVISFFAIQYAIHDISILDESVRPFLIWMLQLLIVHALCLRPGFSFRYPLFLFMIAILALPFLSFDPGEVERARVETDLGVGGGLSHPGGLAEWFGFFAIFFAMAGLEAERFAYRIAAWTIGAGCVFVLGLTVSRSVLFAVALAITIGFRGLLKRGFLPVLLLIILTGGIFATGVFEAIVANYTERGVEESGREVIWPAVFERIFATELTPFIGVGESNSGTYSLSAEKPTPTHNALLHFTLSSGIVPVALFLGFWIQAAWKSMMNTKGGEVDPFRIPYLVYTFVELMFGDWAYMSSWALLTVSVAAGSAIFYGKQRVLVIHSGGKFKLGVIPGVEVPRQQS